VCRRDYNHRKKVGVKQLTCFHMDIEVNILTLYNASPLRAAFSQVSRRFLWRLNFDTMSRTKLARCGYQNDYVMLNSWWFGRLWL
jgi:hypothetical protein